jgi:magnesium-transporting ATPase (P-type)
MSEPADEVLDKIGLSSEQAAERLARFGPNEAGKGKRSPFSQLLPLLGNPLALVLLVASGLSALLGQRSTRHSSRRWSPSASSSISCRRGARRRPPQTGWFVESLCTQTLVLFVIRTYERPWRSRPSRALAATVLSVVALGMVIPLTPVAPLLGFVRLPASFFVFVALATAAYLAVVEVAKRALVRRGQLATG